MHDLLVARWGLPADPVVGFVGTRARALLRDPALLFGTLAELGCGLSAVRAMSLEDRSVVVAGVAEPIEVLTPILLATQAIARDALDGPFVDDKQHAFLERPPQLRTSFTLGLIDPEYFTYRFPEGRAPDRVEWARALGLIDRFDRSEPLLREELRERPDDAPLLFHLGGVVQRLGRPAEAVPLFRRSADLAPNQLDPRSSLALALVECQRYADAKQVYLELIRMTGGDFGEWMNLASVCLDTRELDEGRRAVERALGLEPRSPHGHAVAARLAESLGDHVAAAKHCDTAEAYLAGSDRTSPMYVLIVDLVAKVRQAIEPKLRD